MKSLTYFLVYLLPLTVFISFQATGILTFLPIIIFFGFLPVLELMLKPDTVNLDKKVAYDEKNKSVYDWILYLAIPVQVGFLVYFLFVMKTTPVGSIEFFGRIVSMGLMCGVLGINVGHELGHRRNRTEQFLGEILLLTSLNTHFLPYHNGGHHRNVATPKDAATATKNQLLFTFWITSHVGSYVEAWRLNKKRMTYYSIANVLLLISIYYFFNLAVLGAFLIAAVIGILLLETVNYIEHYGLTRKQNKEGIFEPVRHHHSWNSDHPLGRALLFNLSRHSDHHYNGSKKYQILDSLESSPQMPTGYPGMMILAVLQPLWFKVMNKRLQEIQ